MKELLIKLSIICIAGLSLIAFVVPWANYGIEIPYASKQYKLGLDLQGGVELDYKVHLDDAQEEEDYSPEKEKQIIEGLKAIIDKRIEALNINDSVITTASYGGEQHIIVQIPLKGKNPEGDAINIARAKEAIGKVMKILFKERRITTTDEDRAERLEIAEEALEEIKTSSYGFYFTQAKTKDNNSDVEIGSLTITPENLKKYFEFDESALKIGIGEEIYDGTGIGLLAGAKGKWIISVKSLPEISTEDAQKLISLDYIFVSSEPSIWIAAKDEQGRVLNDTNFLNSSVQYNEANQPTVELTFNTEGAEIFGELSTRLVNQQMAIFVGGELLTAPNINEPILGGKAQITGSYTPEEASKLAQDINTGVVPAPIYLTSEKSIDSKLGASSLKELLIAGATGFLLIFIFLIVVYRVSGVLASIALLLYVAIILSIVKVLGITLTLASVAGLILSIGMAIDANILIFERIRDELSSGEKMSKATKTGFKKSWSAIWDSNVTGLIVALILFIFGINLIKGFGLMLGLGILVSLFSVMWISRILIFVVAKRMKNKKLFIGMK